MWVPSFFRRRPPTLNQQKQRIRKVLGNRFRKEQGAIPYYYNKYLPNLIKNVLADGNAETIKLPNIKYIKSRENIGEKLKIRFIREQGRLNVRKELLNKLITNVLRNNKDPNKMNLPKVAKFGNDNFNPNNWTYRYRNMKNTVRQYPTSNTSNESVVIIRNKNGPWRLATTREIKRINNMRVNNYGRRTQ